MTSCPLDPPAVVISGGETTVDVTTDEHGGPNQEFVLTGGLNLPEGAVLTSVDTDGIDGNSDAAGAIFDEAIVADTELAKRSLEANDTNVYLNTHDTLIETGPTGTNVNDLRILVVGPGE